MLPLVELPFLCQQLPKKFPIGMANDRTDG
jgi:hypothetical protein